MAGLSDQEIDLIAQRIVADLTGRGGAYTTGAILPVDGGISVYAPPAILSET